MYTEEELVNKKVNSKSSLQAHNISSEHMLLGNCYTLTGFLFTVFSECVYVDTNVYQDVGRLITT